jgi:hypothetical protein
MYLNEKEPGSSVSIVSGYGLDDRVIQYRSRHTYIHRLPTVSILYNMTYVLIVTSCVVSVFSITHSTTCTVSLQPGRCG